MTPARREELLATLSNEDRAHFEANSAVQVPMTDYMLLLAEKIAAGLLVEHVKNCPLTVPLRSLEEKVDRLRMSFAKLVGLMLGSGTLGGGVVAGLAALIKSL